MEQVTRIFNPDNPLDQNIEKYKVIMTHTPVAVAGAGFGQRAPGIYTFDIPPLGSNTNDTNYNQCFITTKKIIVDPMSVDQVNKRNPNPIWRSMNDPIGGGGAQVDYAMGCLVAEFSLPSKNQGLVQAIGDDATIGEQQILYKHQELCYFDIKYKMNYDGIALLSDSVSVNTPGNATISDLSLGQINQTDVNIGQINYNNSGAAAATAFQVVPGPGPGTNDVELVKLGMEQDAKGSSILTQNPAQLGGATITHLAGAQTNSYGITGNSILFAYEPKCPTTCLCGNPFGSKVTLEFRDVLTGSRPCILEDANNKGTDIGIISVEFEVTMVKNRVAK